MPPFKFSFAVSLIVEHLWLVFHPILVVIPPGLPFAGSLDDNNNNNDASAFNRGLPDDDALPQDVPAAVLPPTPVLIAPAPSVALEPGWPAIPETLPYLNGLFPH